MKINKEQLKRLAELPDAALWAQITALAKSHGYTLPDNAPSHENLEKIRRALSGTDKISLSDAARILNNYKGK